ncbi:MAG: hypothetical protein HC890_01255 [Chloroflexaceae bacterium]|nr:hypothetical protein [Chloroflexaceae bacterium]
MAVNLSGTWLGTYWQSTYPTRFEMSLVQGENTLSGRISDDGPLGEASLTGEVIGSRITFTKRYLVGARHAIAYGGDVAVEGNYMHGQWALGTDSGTWEAHRSDDNLSLNLEIRQAAKIPAGVV